MILGLGSDIVDIRRIERAVARFGSRFLARVFTEGERRRAQAAVSPRGQACLLAKRFAAKEACAKALGTGFAEGVWWRDLDVVALPSGRPALALTGGAAARLAAITPEGMTAQVDLSVSDDYPMAQAVVVISAIASLSARPA